MLRRKTPSRERYERDHPVVAIRVTQEMLMEMEALRARGRSWGDILRVGLGRQTAADRSLEEARRQGYAEGRARFSIAFPCSVCGQPIEVETPNVKEFVAKALMQARWVHAACTQRGPR